MEPGNLMQRDDDDEHFGEDANEMNFDDNEYAFAHCVVIFKQVLVRNTGSGI